MHQLQWAIGLCEKLFGPSTLRLARLLTELGRQYFSLEMDQVLDPSMVSLYSRGSRRSHGIGENQTAARPPPLEANSPSGFELSPVWSLKVLR